MLLSTFVHLLQYASNRLERPHMLKGAKNAAQVQPRWHGHRPSRPRRRKQPSFAAAVPKLAAAAAAAPAITPAVTPASLGTGLGAFVGFAVAPFASAALRKLFSRRRPQHRAFPSMSDAASATFSVATFNLRGVMDRWRERQPLLRQCLKEVDADVLCFQECLTGEYGQERRLLPPWYHVFPCKSALANLACSGGLPRLYADTVERLLSVPPLRYAMVQLPAAVEALRERLKLQADLFRTVRDLTMAPFFGNSVACRIAEAHEIKHSTLVLGDWRAAQRIEFYIGHDGAAQAGGGKGEDGQQQQQQQQQKSQKQQGWQRDGGRRASGVGGRQQAAAAGERSVVRGRGGFKVWVVNTHLDHAHQDNRQRQAAAVCEWMEREKADCAAILLCGDFNGAPHEPFHAALRKAGYASAHAARHGREPQGTWPTGIQAPLMDHGPFECLDYVYVWAAPDCSVDVLAADVYGLTPSPGDPTLYPSDHAAVKATIRISRRQAADLRQPGKGSGSQGVSNL